MRPVLPEDVVGNLIDPDPGNGLPDAAMAASFWIAGRSAAIVWWHAMHVAVGG